MLFTMHLSMAQSPKRINAKLFYSLTQKHPKALIIDVRPSKKFVQYRIEKAKPLPDKAELLDLPKTVSFQDTIFVYCEIEKRSPDAAATLDSLGYQHVYELKGGLISWRRNGLPLDDSKL